MSQKIVNMTYWYLYRFWSSRGCRIQIWSEKRNRKQLSAPFCAKNAFSGVFSEGH